MLKLTLLFSIKDSRPAVQQKYKDWKYIVAAQNTEQIKNVIIKVVHIQQDWCQSDVYCIIGKS